ncbi:ABC transporter ATP-binding protein [Candidatus Bathyarchaeota archaeon A05DMB-2]|jgi:tungstate transport system ATP-binding protein|nr:ABC transporter ATP-binding protein [Candidatus Bathyarchaeota archaeon A05DMB-2]
MAALVEIKNLSKSFGDRTVLDNIMLQIEEGEILALLGPNGSGKTTLLKILAFLEKPTSGEVTFQGVPVTAKNVERLRLQSAMVFQRTMMFSTSVYNNVAYGLRMRKLPKAVIKEEVSKALSLVKLEGFEQRPAKKLSGGEQQRVALARALVLKTKLLLLDEPTANLDPKNAAIVEDVIATANRDLKTTIVMATHNMFQAKTLPNRIALISDGVISEVGEPSEIFGELSKNLASFAAVDNTFVGTAETTEDGTTVVDIGNGVRIEATAHRSGEISVFISPQDIILSKSAVASSARNVFKGRITSILDSGSLVKLAVDVGQPFTVQITKRSFSEMGLNLGSEVYIAFKASGVQVV